jgi:hypothetical protein
LPVANAGQQASSIGSAAGAGEGAADGSTPVSNNPRHQTADACRTCNGIWSVHGIANAESCNCRTTDGGKRCRDGADCQGMCVAAEEPEREIVEVGPPARGFFIGRCSELATVFGCNRLIDRGAAAHGPTSLAEPPTSMCVD